MFGFGRRVDWHTSRAHLLLLTKFAPYSARDSFPAYWSDPLGEPPSVAIKRFIKDGYIQPCHLEGKVDIKFKVTELKGILKKRGLKCTGRKADLIARLIENNYSLVQEITRDVDAFECTPLGCERVVAFKQEMQDERDQAERDVLNLLDRRDFIGASRRMARFEATQVFSRGMGIDWKNYNPDYNIAVLKTIFEETPQLLSILHNELLGKFRLAAGMMHLWGESSAKKWFDQMPETGMHLDADTCIRMLVFFGIHKRNLAEYRSAGVKTVKVLVFQDEYCCPQCRALAEKRFPLARTPELPLPSCTSLNGCRCTTVSADYL